MGRRSTALKSQILDVAHLLFSEKGYESTPVSSIIDYLGISKGAFYHYFGSKEEVLEEIVMNYSNTVVERLYEISFDTSLNGVEKFEKMFMELQAMRKQNASKFTFLTNLLINKDNHRFHYQYTEKILELTKPPLVNILQQGVKEGLFAIQNPDETAELIIRMGSVYRSRIGFLSRTQKDNPNNLIKIQNIVEFIQDTIERLLGLKTGTMDFISHGFQNSL